MEELFSERNGLITQSDSYSVELRNAIVTSFFNQFGSLEEGSLFYYLKDVMDLFGIEQKPQVHDDATLRYNKEQTIAYIQKCSWNRLFDFVEYVLTLDEKRANALTEKYNRIFRMHGCKYRLVDGKAVPIVNNVEIKAVENALHTGVNAVDDAFSEAIALFSKKVDPDYNAVIAKSSNALESMVLTIAHDHGVMAETLGKAITELENNGVVLDPDMKAVIKKIYQYDCNAGIRHGGTEPVTASEEDAVFVIVITSAIINYLNALRLR